MAIPLLLSLLLQPATASEVEMSTVWLRAMLPPDAEKPEQGPFPWVSGRDVVLTEAEDAVRIQAAWRIEAVEPGWVDLPIVDASVRLDRATLGGAGVPLKALNDGRRHLVAWIEKPTTLVVEGEIVGELRRGVTLALLPAPVGRMRVETKDPVVKVASGSAEVIELDGRFWTGASSMVVSSTSEKPAAKTGQLAVGAVGMGVTVSDGAMDVRARLRWRVVRGSLATVSFTAPGAGADLAVTGPILAKWTRSGDLVTAELLEPQKAAVELEVRWSSSLPDADEAKVPFPVVEPQGVFRTERSVQIGRDGDREVVADLGSWEPIPTASLPEIARDLIVGTPASAWRITDSSRPSLGLLRFSPVSGPPTIVDVAAYDGALSQDGRLLMRAHYTVRNDRGAFLRVTPPPGTRIVGARVGGEPASIARDGDSWLVPLLKSVETVQGLLNFPVDLLILSDGTPFADKDERRIPLPVVDAEVAVSRVTLSLPVGWDNRLDDGESGTVADFTEGTGITYGFAAGDDNVAKADALFQDAVGAWMENDFDRAQQALEDLRSIGADNENINRLQSNIDLVFGNDGASEGGGGQAVALQRRVKEQAQARAGKDKEFQAQLLEEADEAYLSGDYSKAEEAYNKALDIGENLERLEQEESVEQSYSNVQVREKLAKAESKKKGKKDDKPSELNELNGLSGFVEIDFSDEEEELVDYDGDRPPPKAEFLAGGEVPVTTGKQSPGLDALVAQEARKDEERKRLEAEAVARRQAEEAASKAAQEAAARRYAEEERRAAEASAAAKSEAAERARYEEERRRAEEDMRARYPTEPSAAPTADSGVLKRSRPTVNVSLGAKKKAGPAAPPPPPPAPPPVIETYDSTYGTSQGQVLSKEFLQQVPSGRTFESSAQQIGGVAGEPSPEMSGATYDQNTYMDFDGVDIQGELAKPQGGLVLDRIPKPEPEGFAPLDVTASTLDVVIPTYGETVRYQHLLLPAGQAHAVVVRAKKNKKRGNR